MDTKTSVSDSEDDIKEPKYKKSRGNAKNWVKTKEFEDASDAESYIENEGIWRKSSKKRSLEGEKIAYRCIYGNYRKRECPASIYLLYHSENMKVSLYSTENKHNHNKMLRSTRRLDSQSKKLITDLYKKGIHKPSSILSAFKDEDLLVPPKSQLITFLRSLREENEVSGISTIELKNWCIENQIKPEDSDTLFVLDFKIDSDDVKIVLSTKRLLENLDKSDLLQIDTRYKLFWHNFYVIMLGTSDQDNIFHPFAVCIYEKENVEDFSFIFNSLLKYNKNWKPNILLTDGNEDIKPAFINIFKNEPKLHLICYTYLVQMVEKKLKSLNLAYDIKNDINLIHHCASSEAFDEVSKLFIQKYSNEEEIDEFLNYFEEEWIKTNQNWYEGIALGYPSTNIGIENLNIVIKKLHTIRERLPLEQFLNNLESLLSKWSKERHPLSPDYIPYNFKTNITLKDWTEAYQWTKLNLTLLQVETRYYMSASDTENVSITKLYTQNEKIWETFDEFKEIYFRICFVETENDLFTCTCVPFLKNYKCKHALGLKIRLGKVSVPSGVVNISSGVKRKRGRPPKARKAILI